jgi:hypothetical protein
MAVTFCELVASEPVGARQYPDRLKDVSSHCVLDSWVPGEPGLLRS